MSDVCFLSQTVTCIGSVLYLLNGKCLYIDYDKANTCVDSGTRGQYIKKYKMCCSRTQRHDDLMSRRKQGRSSALNGPPQLPQGTSCHERPTKG